MNWDRTFVFNNSLNVEWFSSKAPFIQPDNFPVIFITVTYSNKWIVIKLFELKK